MRKFVFLAYYFYFCIRFQTEYAMTIFGILKKVCGTIVAPVQKEFVFFSYFFILISATLLTNTVRSILEGDLSRDYLLLGKGLSWAIFIAYFFTCIVSLTKSRVLKYLLYVILIGLFSINLFLRLVFGLTLSPLIVLMIGETNTNEASEFARTFLLSGKAFIAYFIMFLLVISLFFEKRMNKWAKKFIDIKFISIAGSIILIIMLIGGILQIGKMSSLYQCESIDDLEKWSEKNKPNDIDFVTGCLYAIKGPFAARKENEKAIISSKETLRQRHKLSDESSPKITVVYILGESFIKHHSSLYGYSHQTNPMFEKEKERGNLFVFTDVVSPSNATTDVAKNTFSTNCIAEGEKWYDKPFFPIVFRQAGFDVSMYDNQADFNLNANFTFSLNSFLYNKEIMSMAYTHTCPNTFKYDEELIDKFLQSHRSTEKNNLAILHLMGQHIETKERYPLTSENIRFTRDSIHRYEPYMNDYKRFLIASYDNATYYNDRIIGKIFERLKEENAIVVYFSDHGDEVYDYRDNEGRRDGEDYPNLLKYQFEIPLFIWCSDLYKSLHPELVEAINNATSKPYMIDVISHTLFRLAGITTPCYLEDRDITSPRYKARKRVVKSPERDYDYDAIVSKNKNEK